MYGKLATLSIALLVGGCAARLPLQKREAAVAQTVGALRTAVPVPREDPAESGLRLSMLPVSFEPGGRARVEAEGEERRKRHELALFVGFTAERGEGGVTVGLDYTYWINERFGVGPFVDYVAGEIDAVALGAGVWFRPIRHCEALAFYVAPGLDFAREETRGERSWEVKALLRLGAAYAFDAGRGFRLIPSFYVDLIAPDKQAYVLGLSIAREF